MWGQFSAKQGDAATHVILTWSPRTSLSRNRDSGGKTKVQIVEDVRRAQPAPALSHSYVPPFEPIPLPLSTRFVENLTFFWRFSRDSGHKDLLPPCEGPEALSAHANPKRIPGIGPRPLAPGRDYRTHDRSGRSVVRSPARLCGPAAGVLVMDPPDTERRFEDLEGRLRRIERALGRAGMTNTGGCDDKTEGS